MAIDGNRDGISNIAPAILANDIPSFASAAACPTQAQLGRGLVVIAGDLYYSDGATASPPTTIPLDGASFHIADLVNAINDAAAQAAGVAVGAIYRNGSVLMVRTA